MKIINLYADQPLIREQRGEIEDFKGRLDFRLNDLVLESKIKELDIKIDIYKEIIKILGAYKMA